jgi:hypothetical protein
MQLHSLVVSEPASILTGFATGLLTFYLANLCGIAPHNSLILGCFVHFVTNTWVGGHINLYLLDFFALVIRMPAAVGSAMWMGHLINTGHLL